MKVTLQQLRDSIHVLARIAREQPLPQMTPDAKPAPPAKLHGKTKYKIGRIWIDAKGEYAKLEERRLELIRQNGGTETTPGDVRMPMPAADDSVEERGRKQQAIKAVDKEFNEWLEAAVDLVAIFDPLSFEEMENSDLTPEEWGLLQWMVAPPADLTVAPAPPKQVAPAPEPQAVQATATAAASA